MSLPLFFLDLPDSPVHTELQHPSLYQSCTNTTGHGMMDERCTDELRLLSCSLFCRLHASLSSSLRMLLHLSHPPSLCSLYLPPHSPSHSRHTKRIHCVPPGWELLHSAYSVPSVWLIYVQSHHGLSLYSNLICWRPLALSLRVHAGSECSTYMSF